MQSKLIDGKKIGAKIFNEVKSEVLKLDFKPIFCDVLVGSDPASRQYVNMKAKRALAAGMNFHRANFNEGIKTEELIREIKKINKIPYMCGLIVQLPLPAHINTKKVLDAISPKLDVDVTGRVNSEKFYQNKPSALRYPTVAAVLKLLESLEMDFTRKSFLVLGQGQLVGKPLTHELLKMGYKVNVARSTTQNIPELLKQADVVVSAVGKPKFLKGDMLKKGSVLIDAGTSESFGGIVGDADFESVRKVAGYISPVPGGVGPVTVSMLLKNVLLVAKSQIK
ncbi:MAG: bifunctional 5,10-methylenetetrahydrofolate dehydrogenase/5,10-methenyltetrahydrofolate cyclohydrolase [Candidatus Doudnabacteria bacterium]|nr:bifunctional 5,10-methylenetetrahydrofolate dehydrogenase/5,10-methenyltetrahydrofolate cyclohydrolase [Candidatus Doudnabacteria bacterium]